MAYYTLFYLYERKEIHSMKKYVSPEMEMMDFIIDTSIAADIMSIFNDGQFGGW